METTSLGPSLLWLLILLVPALLVTVLCLCCRDLPGPSFNPNDSSYQTSGGLVILKRPYPSCQAPISCPPELPPQSSPRHQGILHQNTSPPDPDSRSEPSYENEDPVHVDEDEDSHNEGYLVVLPDESGPNPGPVPLFHSVPNLDSVGLRDSPSSMLGGEDYVNVPDSTEVSLGGSCEYVNVPEVQDERTSSNRTPVTDQDGEEEGPDYENVQEQNGHSFT